MQEGRLFRIIYYLLDKGKSTAPELAMQRRAKAAVSHCLTILFWINPCCPVRLPSTYSVGKVMDIENTIAAKLMLDKRMAFRVYDEFAEEVKEDEQGNLYVQTKLPGNDALYRYLLSFAEHVEVLEPEIVREQMKEKLTAMRVKYIT